VSVEDMTPLRRLERIGFLILRDTSLWREDFLAFQHDLPDCWILPRRLVEEMAGVRTE
jgi:hypothetical protein